jgi:bifunctional DNA-binding transcriptional regulator/antitoxin component of YhaV-PrlF toxin-antitoxin module
MQAAKLSGKGRLSLPKNILSRYNWSAGQKLQIIDTGDGVLLKSAQPFKPTQLNEVVGILQHSGKSVSLEEMEEAVKKSHLL